MRGSPGKEEHWVKMEGREGKWAKFPRREDGDEAQEGEMPTPCPSLIFGRIAKQNPVYEMVQSVCLSVHLRQQFGLALQVLRLSSLQNDHWQYLFQTSHLDRPSWVLPIGTFVCDLEGSKFNTSDVETSRPWWVLSIVTFVCDLDLECSKFQGQMCNWHLTSLYLNHGQ